MNLAAAVGQLPEFTLQEVDIAAAGLTDTGNRTKVYSLSVVRLADPGHAQLAFINVTDSTQTVYTVCASTDLESLSQSPLGHSQTPGGENANESSVALCSPDTALAVNVSSETKWVSLQPGLLYPEVEGIRVEVKGQVLSQGGDVSADQIADTSGRTNSSRYRLLVTSVDVQALVQTCKQTSAGACNVSLKKDLMLH